MTEQIIFLLVLGLTISIFAYTVRKIKYFFSLTKPFQIGNFRKRFAVMFNVAFGQSKIFRRPFIGFIHALVFWGFCVISVGSFEMMIDGLLASDRILSHLGVVYDVITASGDVFAALVLFSILIFLIRRIFLNIKRFHGIEMKSVSHFDAIVALCIIFLLMVSLIAMNTFYYAIHFSELKGTFPVSSVLSNCISPDFQNKELFHEISWWSHILLIFIFANILPYSKHFHVFMSIPNVFLSRLEPLGKLQTMDRITTEVKLMMNPETAYTEPAADQQLPPERFGVKDVTDGTWKNYLDSLACTECGRCTSVCPANLTGKKLSPRKIFMDFRARMKEKGNSLLQNGLSFDDNKTLLLGYISEEELWACTMCNACANECPVNINHPSLIVDLRRYLVLEEGAAPPEIKTMFSTIENNGAPWQFSPEDRMMWANDLDFAIPIVSDVVNAGKTLDYLFWVGCAGAFDDRYKKVVRSFVKILHHLHINYAVLGKEESCTGDPARRAGNEMLYQMQALLNISLLNGYGIKKIITACPHCYNIFKNEYPDLEGKYEVIHHTQFLKNAITNNSLNLNSDIFKDKRIVFHDPCYLGRANNEYEAPRSVLHSIPSKIVEMKRNKSFSLCCGAGGGQMFKEAEKGDKEVYAERTDEALNLQPDIIATACPFCMTMLSDGLKYKDKEEEIMNYDIAELVAMCLHL